jgi:FlaA1/EpsC-like NDP-sugar epimerase
MIGRIPAPSAAASRVGLFGRIKKYQVVFVHDLIIACLSLPFALYLRLGNDFLNETADVLLYGSPAFAVLAGVIFHAGGMYRGVWRYASTSDLVAVVKSATVAVLVFMPLMFLVNRLNDIPRAVPSSNG